MFSFALRVPMSFKPVAVKIGPRIAEARPQGSRALMAAI